MSKYEIWHDRGNQCILRVNHKKIESAELGEQHATDYYLKEEMSLKEAVRWLNNLKTWWNFLTKNDPHPLANNGGGIGLGDPSKLYDKKLEWEKLHKLNSEWKYKKLKLKLSGAMIASESGWHPLWYDENENGSSPWDYWYLVGRDSGGIRIERANGTRIE